MSSFAGSEPPRYTARELTPIVVERWPTEGPLFGFAVLIATVGWLLLAVTIIGLVYALMFAVFFAIMHVAFIAYVRGSAVRLGPNQFPELHATVERLSLRMGLQRVPEAYLMQAGGSLNAFATRFLRSHIIVLFSDLLDACGENTAARDMIIAHELGHIRSGHLRMHWYLLPACLVPFLMSALSRAREYTCDRYGLAGAGDAEGAGIGLAILAAGAEHGPRVNRLELVRQRALVETSGLMTLGEWLGTHPPLAKRLAAVDPSLGGTASVSRKGAIRAGLAVAAVPTLAMAVAVAFVASGITDRFRALTESARVAQAGTERDSAYAPPPDAAERARADILRLARFLEEDGARRPLPWNGSELYQRLDAEYPGKKPVDPYDGDNFGYDVRGSDFVIYSSGPDAEPWTDDDIRYDSRSRRFVGGSTTEPSTEQGATPAGASRNAPGSARRASGAR